MYLKIYEIVTYISGILYYLSATINPILYNIMSIKFREAFKETFSRCCHLSFFKSKRPLRSYSVLSRSVPTGCDPASGSGNGSGGKDSSANDEPTFQSNTTMLRRGTSQSLSDNNINKRSKQSIFLEIRTRESPEETTEPSDTKLPNTYEMKACDMIALHVKSSDIMLNEQSKVSECCGLFPNKDKEKLKVNRKYSAHYTPAFLNENVYRSSGDVNAVSPCHISNDNLKEVGKDGFEDELTTYMREIQRRGKTINGIPA